MRRLASLSSTSPTRIGLRRAETDGRQIGGGNATRERDSTSTASRPLLAELLVLRRHAVGVGVALDRDRHARRTARRCRRSGRAPRSASSGTLGARRRELDRVGQDDLIELGFERGRRRRRGRRARFELAPRPTRSPPPRGTPCARRRRRTLRRCTHRCRRSHSRHSRDSAASRPPARPGAPSVASSISVAGRRS